MPHPLNDSELGEKVRQQGNVEILNSGSFHTDTRGYWTSGLVSDISNTGCLQHKCPSLNPSVHMAGVGQLSQHACPKWTLSFLTTVLVWMERASSHAVIWESVCQPERWSNWSKSKKSLKLWPSVYKVWLMKKWPSVKALWANEPRRLWTWSDWAAKPTGGEFIDTLSKWYSTHISVHGESIFTLESKHELIQSISGGLKQHAKRRPWQEKSWCIDLLERLTFVGSWSCSLRTSFLKSL